MLFILPVLQEAQRARPAPAPLTARLANPRPPEIALPKVEPPPEPVARPRPAPVAKAVPQPAPAPALPERILSVEPAKQAADTAFVVPAAPAMPVAPASPVGRAEPQPAAASGGLDAGTVAQFRLELMDLARRYKKYPRIAQENNWEGRVELRIAIGENGAIASISVKKSAGRAVLDDEAQAMLRTAKSKATIPPALRGKAFVVEIPVEFGLKDEQ